MPGSELRSITSKHRQAASQGSATWFSDLDLDAPGKQIGHVHFPHSPHDDAWGTVRVPLAIIAHGEGPTILLEGGNHGDEYEGPIALGELIRSLAPTDIQGRLIIIPAINTPAVDEGRRTSPVDGQNMNRVFPGDHGGTITQQIAAYVNDELIPRSDAFLSLHSGGSSLNIVPSTIVMPSGDAAQFQRCLDAAAQFGAALSVVMDNLGDQRLCVTSAMLAGLTCVSTEMAGGGLVNPAAARLCREGLRRVLNRWGVMQADVPAAAPSIVCDIAGASAYVIASEAGVFEPAVALGATLQSGDLAGHIHFLSDPAKAPVALHTRVSGIVYALRQIGRVRPGNTCMLIASSKPSL